MQLLLASELHHRHNPRARKEIIMEAELTTKHTYVDRLQAIVRWIQRRSMGFRASPVDVRPTPFANRILPLEGLRGFAASLVFLVHFGALFGKYAQGAPWYAPFGWMASFGHAGVDLFFILSGYLICGIVMKPTFEFVPFVTARVRRLYPAFLAVFAIYLALSLAVPSRSRVPESPSAAAGYLLSNLLMLPGMLPIKAMITVAWSLSYEWFFYLALPLVVALLNLRKWRWGLRTLFFSIASAAWVVTAVLGKQNLGRFAMFGAGILLWELRKRVPNLPAQRIGGLAAMVLLVANLLAIGAYSRHPAPQLVLTVLSAFYVPSLFISGAFFTLYAAFGDGWLSRMFSWSGLRYVGKISYSYYLIHGITLAALQCTLHKLVSPHRFSLAAFLLLLPGCYLATLFTAAILYEYVERPFSFPAASRPVSALPHLASWEQRLALSAGSKG